MQKKNVTIKYIAEKAGVSFSTVGRALRNEVNVNEKTKKKILKIAQKLNYYPNMIAKSLRVKKTKTIGIILNDLKNPLYNDIIKAVEETINILDYSMLICDSNYNYEMERKNILSMLSKNVEGVIISPVNEKSQNLHLLTSNDIKAVYIDIKPDLEDSSYVYVDHEKAAFSATDYLIKNNHKNILLLNGPYKLSSSKYFLSGYIKALSHHNIKIKNNLIKFINININNSFQVFKEIYKNNNMEVGNNFTGIVTLSDLLALGVYKASKTFGFKIPDDYSIVGYDDIFISEYLSPPLTTIHQPKFRIGKQSINILLDLINNKIGNKEIIINPNLIERESVKKL